MYIIVIGLGEVGRHLLAVLDGEGHDVVAIDQDPAAVHAAETNHDVMSLVGYGASETILDKAGVAQCDLLVAVTDHDEVNLIAALAARQRGARRVVARAQGNAWVSAHEGVRYGLLGVDVVLNPRVLVAQELARIARSHGALDVVDLSEAQVELVKLETSNTPRLLNKPLAKLDLPGGTLVAAVVRKGALFIPGGADVLLPEDQVYLIGKRRDIVASEDVFSRQREAKRVCIIGGGVVGRALAQTLAAMNVEVLIVEQQRARAEALSVDLPEVTVVHGDGTDMRLFEEEEVGSYDLFAALTAADEINLMAALLAKRQGVTRTAALVQRADYTPIYRQLGIDIALSPRVVASDHILRFSRSRALRSLTVLEGGQAEVLEMATSQGSKVLGTALERLNLPRGALVGAIVRDGKAIVPRGKNMIELGDTVILMATPTARAPIESLFRGREA